jgi:hypothetical protein
MKVWEQRLVPAGFALAGVLFLVAAIKPVIKGQTLNAAFLIVGALCLILGIAIARKSRGGTGPGGA